MTNVQADPMAEKFVTLPRSQIACAREFRADRAVQDS